MKQFENLLIRDIHVSRYIASYSKVSYRYGVFAKYQFKDWLRQLVINGEHLTEDEVTYICNFRDNGKLELEENAKSFLEKRLNKEL